MLSLSRERVLNIASQIQGWMSCEELDWLHSTCKDRVVIEVGVWKGRSTTAIAAVAEAVYAVDTWPENSVEYAKSGCTPCDAMAEAKSNLLYFDNVNLMDSREAFEAVLNDLINKVGVLFIDGCHRYDSVSNDLLLDRFVADGGIVSGHDRTCSGVQLAIAERYGIDRLRTGPGSIWWVKK